MWQQTTRCLEARSRNRAARLRRRLTFFFEGKLQEKDDTPPWRAATIRLSSLIATAGIARASNRSDSGARADRKIGNRGQGSASWCRSGFGSACAAHTASSPEGASGDPSVILRRVLPRCISTSVWLVAKALRAEADLLTSIGLREFAHYVTEDIFPCGTRLRTDDGTYTLTLKGD